MKFYRNYIFIYRFCNFMSSSTHAIFKGSWQALKEWNLSNNSVQNIFVWRYWPFQWCVSWASEYTMPLKFHLILNFFWRWSWRNILLPSLNDLKLRFWCPIGEQNLLRTDIFFLYLKVLTIGFQSFNLFCQCVFICFQSFNSIFRLVKIFLHFFHFHQCSFPFLWDVTNLFCS